MTDTTGRASIDSAAASTDGDALLGRVSALGVRREARAGGWFTRLASRYFKRNLARSFASAARDAGLPLPLRAEKAIFRACVKSAVSGAACGAISTTATVLTAETEGLAGV